MRTKNSPSDFRVNYDEMSVVHGTDSIASSQAPLVDANYVRYYKEKGFWWCGGVETTGNAYHRITDPKSASQIEKWATIKWS
jgi:hypothetical protein